MTYNAARRTHERKIGYFVAVFAFILIYILLLYYFQRTVFSPRPGRIIEEADGFHSMLMAVSDQPNQTYPPWLLVRYAIISPLIWLEGYADSPLFQGIYLLSYSLPVVLWRPFGAPRRFAQLILLLIPVLVSFRLAISIYAVAFFMIFIIDKRLSRWALLWYSPAMLLSTSTMFIYALAYPLVAWTRLRALSFINIIHSIIYIIIVSQFLSKTFDLFLRSIDGEVLSTAQNVDLDYSSSTLGFAIALLTGNPFFTAVVSGQYDRLILLSFSILLFVYIFSRLVRYGDRFLIAYILIVISSMLSEGVGAYSLSILLFILLINRRAILNPSGTIASSISSLPREALSNTGIRSS
jgi:hypothetical protein